VKKMMADGGWRERDSAERGDRVKYSMLLGVLLGTGICGLALGALPNTVILNSPDGQVEIHFALQGDGAPVYSITRKEELIIAPSRLRLQLLEDRGFHSFEVIDTKTRSVDQRYELIAAKASRARDHFNELTVSLKEKGTAGRRLDLVFRAYDDGIAFRYLIPSQQAFAQLRLGWEDTQFLFPSDYACYGLNIGRVNTSHEGEFDPLRARLIRGHNMFTLPFTCRSSSGNSAFAIVEADLRDWGGMYLSGLGGGELGVVTRVSRRVDGSGLTVSRAMTAEGIQSPWRVVLLGDSHGKLIESNLLTSLNPPTQLRDTTWIKPGKTAWDWWLPASLTCSLMKVGV
jgi:alpha-glucosidase